LDGLGVVQLKRELISLLDQLSTIIKVMIDIGLPAYATSWE
jgi:hypothetical protein